MGPKTLGPGRDPPGKVKQGRGTGVRGKEQKSLELLPLAGVGKGAPKAASSSPLLSGRPLSRGRFHALPCSPGQLIPAWVKMA